MKNSFALTVASLVIILTAHSCKKEKDDPYSPTAYHLEIPQGFPAPYPDNLTAEGIRLGRMLYYDPILSSNGLTCASCHVQSKAFSAPGHTHPDGETTSIPGHINLAWKKNFLWEGGLGSIEDVCMGDFEPEFFNTNMNDLVIRLNNHSQYPRLFDEAFGPTDFNALTHEQLKRKIVTAIAQFINTLTSSDSRYDQFRNGAYAPTQEEFRGYVIFNTEEGDCFHCHGSVLLTDNKLHNTGLDENPQGRDRGHYMFSNDPLDLGKFISPTLRNVELTAPYMHDGRYQTLEEVVDFYDHGVNLSAPNIDPIMTKAAKASGLHLSAYDKQCLVAFLKMMTDSGFVNNPEYSNPH